MVGIDVCEGGLEGGGVKIVMCGGMRRERGERGLEIVMSSGWQDQEMRGGRREEEREE